MKGSQYYSKLTSNEQKEVEKNGGKMGTYAAIVH